MRDLNLDEILEEYDTGYEKAYKNIPDLVERLRDMEKELAEVKDILREITEIITARGGVP